MNTYYLEINENDETGVAAVAFVDKPAIELNWKQFKSDFIVEPRKGENQEEFVSRCIGVEVSNGKETDQAAAICYAKWDAANNKSFGFQTTDKERRIVSGVLMLANTPIYRRDEQNGEYNVIFTPDTIEKIVNKFFKQGNQSSVNGMHNPEFTIDGVYMFESFIIDNTRGIKAPEGFGDIPQGSWFGSFKVENNDIWDTYIKTGVFKGFSVEGMFNQSLTKVDNAYSVMLKIMDELLLLAQNK
jgi:hypothetical protein